MTQGVDEEGGSSGERLRRTNKFVAKGFLIPETKSGGGGEGDSIIGYKGIEFDLLGISGRVPPSTE